MSDENKVGLNTDPNDINNIERLIKSVDKLAGSLEHLAGTNKGMTDLARMMTTMQATMVTGFRQMETAAAQGGEKLVAERKKLADRQVAEEEKAWERLRFTSEKARSREEAQQDASNARKLAAAARDAEKQMASEMAAENRRAANLNAINQRRDTELNRMRQKSYTDAVRFWEREAAANAAAEEKKLADLKAINQRRDVEINRLNQKRRSDYERFWAQELQAQEAAQAKSLASAIAARARQDAINTAQAQASTARATSSLGALRAGLTGGSSDGYSNTSNIRSSESAILSHNAAMREGHALARGLAGSLGGLWLTYGSLVPLAAGAALATSLKSVLSVGMEVESQLNFVYALGKDLNSLNVNQSPFLTQRAGVSMDEFLTVSDTSLRSIKEAGEAMRGLAQNGQNFTRSIALLPTVLDLATVGEMTAGQAAIALTGAISAFGLEITDAGRVADIFAKTAAESNTSVLAMTESMKQASTVSALFKVSLEDTAAMIGVLAKINITGGAAGTSITNMLTGFYEPTQQAKRALKELRVETSLASGELKPIPQLLEDVRAATANLNDTAKADILGRIVTVRGLKSLSTLLTNLDDFKEKQDAASDAAGFMGQVVQQLENSADGAFKRLSVTVEKDLVGAFEIANPYVQELGQRLTSMFKDPSIKSGLGNLTSNLVQLTTALVDNLSVLGTLTAGYVLYRTAIAPLIALYTAYSAAQAASTVATAAATAAQGTHMAAVLASTGSSAAYTAVLETQTAATAAAAAASRSLSALLIPALGTIGVLVAAAAAAWYLFSDNTSKADEANTKMANSITVVHDALDREIERLKKVNALWDERNGKFLNADRPTNDMLTQAQATVKSIEAQIRAAGQRPEDVRNPVRVANQGMGGGSVGTLSRFTDELKAADANVLKITKDMELFDNVKVPQKALEDTRKSAAGLNTELDAFMQLGLNKNSAGAFDVQNEKLRQMYLDAGKIKEALNDPNMIIRASSDQPSEITRAAKAEQARVAALRVDLKQLNEQIQGGLSGRPEKEDKKSANDSLRARLEEIKLSKELLAIEQETEAMRLRNANKAGTLGDLGLLDAENKMAKEKIQNSIDSAKASIAEVSGVENKRAATVKYQNELAAGEARMAQQDIRTADAKAALFEKMSQDATKFSAKTFQEQGRYVDAFLLEYTATYGPTIARIEADLTTNLADEERKRLQGHLVYLSELKKAGKTSEMGKELTEGFNKDLGKLQASLSQLSALSTGQTGIDAIFTNASSAASQYAAQLPDLVEKQRQLQDLATANPDNPKLQEQATAELEKMRNLAEQMRSMWLSVGQSVGDSLTTAFGRGGEALGGLLQATIAYGVQKERIEDSRKASVDSGALSELEAQAKAAKANSSAQIAYYGKMAAAAKGYFKEGSTGYKALGAVEKATQLAGLVEAARMFAVKSGYIMGLLGLKIASDQEATASEGAYTLASLAKSALRATAAGIEAVLNQGKGDPYSAFGRMAAMAAIVVGLGVALSGGIGGNSAPTSAEERQKLNGTGSVLGDTSAKSDSIKNSLDNIDKTSGLGLAHTISMDNSLKSLVANIGGLASLLVRGTTLTTTSTEETIGTAQKLVSGTTVDILDKLLGGLAGKIAGSIFGGKTTVEDVGLTVSKGSLAQLMNSASVSQYVDTKKDGGWFRGDKYNTSTTSLGSEVNDQFSKIFQSLFDTISSSADALGVGGTAFENRLKTFVIDIGEISTKGMTGAEIETALGNAFSKLGDDMATFAVDGLLQFQKVGEGSLETLTRVANNFLQVGDVLSVLGMQFNATGISAVVLSENLIKAAGGLDKLTENTGYFVDNFLTEAERMKPVGDSIAKAFADLKLTDVPKSMDAFKNLVLAQDLSTDAGQRMYAALIAIAPAFKTFADYTAELSGTVVKSAADIRDERKDIQDQLDELTMNSAQLAAKARAQIDSSNLKLYDELKAREALAAAYEAESTALKESIDKLKSFATSIKTFRDSLVLGNLSTLSLTEKANAARDQYSSTLAAAIGGDTTAQSGLSAAASAFLTASQAGAGTQQQYIRDYAKVQSDMALLAASVGSKITDAEKQQASLDKQVAGLLSLNDTVKAGTLSVVDAIKSLQTLGVIPASVAVPVSSGALAASTPTSAVPVVYVTPVSSGEQAIIDELKAVKAELVAFKTQSQAADIQIAQNTGKTARIVQRLDDAGIKIREDV